MEREILRCPLLARELKKQSAEWDEHPSKVLLGARAFPSARSGLWFPKVAIIKRQRLSY